MVRTSWWIRWVVEAVRMPSLGTGSPTRQELVDGMVAEASHLETGMDVESQKWQHCDEQAW
ncbi:hypothetical protein MN608_02018 [Microdochium nivale]|nr:hypothetical protein MN608_02018 [Microdochium nivale]